VITAEQAEALRRASSQPDLFSGDFDDLRDERIYAPLVNLGFLEMTVKPWPANDLYEIVHYETTALGKWALQQFEKSEHGRSLPPDEVA
jgi:hypothetical protein